MKTPDPVLFYIFEEKLIFKQKVFFEKTEKSEAQKPFQNEQKNEKKLKKTFF